MVRVTLSGETLAESNETIVVEGSHYFPPDSVNKGVLTTSNSSSTCPWKGIAAYYNAEIKGKTPVKDVAWYYPQAKDDRAKHIEGYVAFYKNKVEITGA